MRAWVIVLCLCPLPVAFLACGANDDPAAGAVDAGRDAFVRSRDAAMADAAPPPYVPQGTRCVRDADAATPVPFLPPGSGGFDGGGVEGGPSEAGSAQASVPLVLTTGDVVAKLPVIVPITFDGDDLRDPIEDFVASVGCTAYWHAIASDYGIGDAVSAPPVHLSVAAPATISDDEIRQWLNKQLATSSAFPPPDANIVYAIFYPMGTSVTANGAEGCTSFGGYHSWSSYQGKAIAYAVMPRCAPSIDAMTAITSHELIESATDPGPGGFASVSDEFLAWALPGSASEVGDMCEHASNANFEPDGYPFRVQRSWSNKASFLGHDPCVPADSVTWFVARPVMNDFVHVSFFGQDAWVRGVKLASGAQTTIDLSLSADGPMGQWTVSTQDLTQWTLGQSVLQLSLDQGFGSPGDVLKLTIRRVGTNMQWNANPFMVRSTNNGAEHLWFGVVGD